jgi:TolB-like protein
MTSTIKGYEYDIFISYRQKDNKGSRWVSEFVEALKTELGSTFKEEISVYFDINPHDGLLETHDVDASLKEKLKCLIFIPIISQTYCDPNSFAWQHEFKAFVEQASKDQFGLKIKLPSGNVASRVLPVLIHDVDPEDMDQCQSVLGAMLRGVEFIYKEPGVNRPLRANEDHPQDNINKTYYRDQINKVANAVKEIIAALKKWDHQKEKAEKAEKEFAQGQPAIKKVMDKRTLSWFVLLLALIVAGFIFFPKLFKPTEKLEKSIAVLPFENLSNDPDQDWFSDGITDVIINQLSKISGLRVLGRTSTLRYKGKENKKPISEIGKELGVNYLIEGTVQRHEGHVRIVVQFIRAKNEDHLWAEIFDRPYEDIFVIQSEIAQLIANELEVVISPQENLLITTAPTTNLTAYDLYLRGKDYLNRSYNEEDMRFAMQMYQKAVEIDPDFSLAWAGLAASCRSLYWFNFDISDEILQKTKQYLDKALALAPSLKEVQLEEANYYYQCHRDYSRSIEIFMKLQTEYPNDEEIIFWLAMVYRRMGEFEKSLEYNNLAIYLNPSNWLYWASASTTLKALKDYKKAEDYDQTAKDLNPSSSDLHIIFFDTYITSGQIDKARNFLITNKKYFVAQDYIRFQAHLEFLGRNFDKSILTNQSLTEEGIFTQYEFFSKHLLLGLLYRTVSNPDLSKRHFELAKDFFLEKIRKSGNDHRLYSSLGIACAGLGLKVQALETGNKALEILNFKMDALAGFYPEMAMVMILILLEEYDEALLRLEQIISHTGLITTVEELKLDPFWDPVREHPKFKEIINNPKYQIRL